MNKTFPVDPGINKKEPDSINFSREIAVKLTFRLNAILAGYGQHLPHGLLEESEQLVERANKELYPACYEPEIDLGKSFDKLKTAHGADKINQYVP